MTLKTGITHLSESQRKSFSCRKIKQPCSKDCIHSVLEIYRQHMVGIEMQLPTRDLYRTLVWWHEPAWIAWEATKSSENSCQQKWLPGWTEGDINGMKWMKAIGILELWNTGRVNSAVLFWTYVAFQKKRKNDTPSPTPPAKMEKSLEGLPFHHGPRAHRLWQ